MQNLKIQSAPKVRPIPLRSPLPGSARAPIYLSAIVLLTQPWLLILNFRSFYLMWGEANASQKGLAAALFASEVILFAGTALFAWWLQRRREEVPWAANWAIFLPHGAYLAFATWAVSHSLVPGSVSQWIVQPDTLLFYQWAFMMPALFYSALSLACFPTRRGIRADVGFSLLVTGGIPMLWYLGIQVARGVSLPAFFWITLTIGSSLVCLAGFLRLVTWLYVGAHRVGEIGRGILVFLVALAGPLGGLILNSYIPFPTDFQSPFIYVLAVTNGLLLLVPVTNMAGVDRVVWLGRCALLPFTLYFFLVYLPFLPLAIPAMIVAGAGFLILVPTALLLVHARSVIEPLSAEIREGWGRRAIVRVVLAFCVLPGIVAGGAFLDRHTLGRAMDYVFTPDYRKDDTFRGSRWALQRSLERARDQKEAVYMPFLSEFYDRVVFNGFTLSTSKLQELHRGFFGSELEFGGGTRGMGFNQRRTMVPSARVARQPFPHNVALSDLAVTSGVEDGTVATRAVLTLENQENVQAEYVTTIELPPGVVVSGYWLHVGHERVAGQIFEKKTALWVYRMIRDVTRRDPGVLVYTSPRTLELRVFPFAARESRVTEIEFLTPRGIQENVVIDGRTVPVGGGSSQNTFVAHANGARLVLPAATSAHLPSVFRQPYLHFVIDRSAGANLSATQLETAVRQVATRFPAAGECMITLANYEALDLTTQPIPISEAGRKIAEESRRLPKRGGFLRDRAIKRALLQFRDSSTRPGSAYFSRYPIFVAIGGSKKGAIADDDLAYFARITPDTECFFATNGGPELEALGFDGKRREPVAQRPVHLFRLGTSVAAGAVGTDAAIDFDGPSRGAVEVFDAQAKTFKPVADLVTLGGDSRYARGLAALQTDLAVLENPSRAQGELPEIVRESRESGVLVPSTSYIVVENSAQWRMLKLKEREKLGGNRALDFMETPEPSMILVGAVVVVLGLIRRRMAAI